MTKTAWVFPGQGSQSIGMGSDLAKLPEAQLKFEQAREILGWSVLAVSQSEDDTVSDTLYTQSCLYTLECILVDLIKDKGHSPTVLAGHSLGEYVALYAAGVYEFGSGLRLVQRRAELMSQTSEGAMAALMGFDRDELDAKIKATEGVVLANDNNPSQVVISGAPAAIDAVMDTVKSKRAVKLNVSGAFHSPLMAPAAREFEPVLSAVEFQDASVPVLSNIEPTPKTNGQDLKNRLIRQMTGPVRWREITLQLPELGVDTVMEVGPGKVLTGLIKRTCKTLSLINVGTVEQLEAL
ncbi:MAG: ACP S-malonyltransferase [Cyanobacteria bacterium P01_H01_bin.119]